MYSCSCVEAMPLRDGVQMQRPTHKVSLEEANSYFILWFLSFGEFVPFW